MNRRTVLLSMSALLVCGVAAGGYAYHNHHKYKHVATHEAGMMYRSGWCEPEVMSELVERWQIRSVVNLCRPGEMGEARWQGERDAVTNAGAKLLELDMPLTVDPADPLLQTHMDAIADPDNYPMLVHCQHGVTRTAKFIAMYDIVMRGHTAEQSLDAQPLFGRDQQNVHVTAFAKQFEDAHKSLYPRVSHADLDVLRDAH
ncbi:fused DSP-PTPase phosphatase/NAD kinase-like protein [Alienimonas chondri]|uniref:Tyrosine specific protein phosphatases domain-containing protein n=1 Tax=Alienimonas chondri TaxID=2681879 RepID=A0ABX1VIS5_9PLAN|nr:protein-tyrosine phosphatase family protein [Alienimonas chondri]NNJ28019.1 hypothetical protein [Alienimonas chondri]